MKKRIKIGILACTLLTVGCFPPDEPVPPYTSPGGVETAVAGIGSDYGFQCYFDLSTGTFVQQIHREAWDLWFACAPDNPTIRIQSARKMAVWPTGSTQFSTNFSTTAAEWKFDDASWQDSETAIGTWGNVQGDSVVSLNQVYIIDLGFTVLGNAMGFKKMRILGMNSTHFSIEFADLSATSGTVLSVPKETAYRGIGAKIRSNPEIVYMEPPAADWDLVFTTFTDVVYNVDSTILEPYLVTGCLSQSPVTRTSQFTCNQWDTLAYTALASQNFLTDAHVIGYDWKTYDFDAGVYNIHANQVYFIEDQQQNFYKLRFISFTDDLGQKGYPTFEYQKF